MGSDQIEGIVSVGGSSRNNNSSKCQCAASGKMCDRGLKAQSGVGASAQPQVRFQRLECDCHCLTCSYRTPNTSNRSIDDSALPPGVLAALTETDSEVEDQTTDELRGDQQAPPLSNTSFPASLEESCTREIASGPCARYGHSLTEFHPGHFILFGGTNMTTCFNDLFVLVRGQKRQQPAPPCCPTPSSLPRLASSTSSANNAATTRSSWTELRPLVDAPSPRFGHSCHMHHTKQHLVFFGGTDNSQWFQDLYLLPFSSEGISRQFQKVEYPTNNSASPTAQTSSKVAPCPRRGHTMAAYKDGACVMYGGHSRISLHDVWLLHKDLSWKELPTVGCNPEFPFSDTPEPRYGHTAVVYEDNLYVFGGFCASGPAMPHVWSLDLRTLVWEVVEVAVGMTPTPERRFGHTASLVGNRMIIFGGMNGFPNGRALNDAFQLNLETREWTCLMVASEDENLQNATALSSSSPDGGAIATDLHSADALASLMAPQGRRSHAAALDSSGGCVIIFGGWGDCAVRSEDSCLEMAISQPTLREIARNWIGARVVFPRLSSSNSVTPAASASRAASLES